MIPSQPCFCTVFLLTMALSADDVHRAAHLARIEITAAEAFDVQNKLEGVFRLIERMRAVDTTGIVPMSHAQDVMLPLREDHMSESDPHQRDLYQRNAPAVEDGLYLVPKVIERRAPRRATRAPTTTP